MEPSSFALERPRRLCYLRVDTRSVDRDLMLIEGHLKRLGDLTIEPIKDLSAPGAFPCDLLLVGAQRVPEKDFYQWFESFRNRVVGAGSIWTPALILAEVSFETLRDLLLEAIRDNWYFDIVSPQQVSSLPIRVANLLRIHDHLHELKRYAHAMDSIQNQVQDLERQVASLSQARPVSKP
jgi:hypothetical protein